MADEHQPILELKTSLSIDEIVAMRLGWIQGYTRPKQIKANAIGIPADFSFYEPSLDGSLERYLASLRADTYQDFLDAYNAGASCEVLDEKENAIEQCQKLIHKAWDFRLDIADEISNGESSMLKIDQDTTEKSGIAHYTIRSIERWINEVSKIANTEMSFSKPGTGKSSDAPSTDDGEDIDESNCPSLRKVNSLKTTFAFLVEAFVEATNSDKYRHRNNTPNVIAISKKLEQLATNANKNSPWVGQGHESIKKRITDAIDIKQEILRG